MFGFAINDQGAYGGTEESWRQVIFATAHKPRSRSFTTERNTRHAAIAK